MTGQSNNETQVERRAIMADKVIPSNKKNGPIQVNSPPVVMRLLEENIVSKEQSTKWNG